MSKVWQRLGLMTLGCVAWSAYASNAEASGYLTARFGADHGTPAMPNNFAIYFNPAAMSGMKGTQLTVDASALLRFVDYTRSANALSPSANSQELRNNPNYVQANTGDAKLVNLLAIPYLGISSDFGSSWFRAGYAFYVPFGGLATWNRQNDLTGSPGSGDGPQRWHNISGQILTLYNTFAASAKLGDSGFAIGANVSGIVHNVSTVRARNLDGSDDTVGLGGELVEGRSVVTGWGFNLGASLGLYWANPDESVRLGLSYTSQPGFGTTRMSGTLTQALRTGQPDSTPIDFLSAYPDIVRLGGTVRLSRKVEMRSDFEFARWSTFKNQCVVNRGADCTVDANGTDTSGQNNVIVNIPREFKDAVGWRIGPAYFLNENTELFASYGITTPAVPKRTIDASTIDALRMYFTVGARFNVSKKVGIGVSYNHIYFTDVNTNGESFQNRYRNPDGSANASTSPSGDGTYKSQIGMLNANLNYTF